MKTNIYFINFPKLIVIIFFLFFANKAFSDVVINASIVSPYSNNINSYSDILKTTATYTGSIRYDNNYARVTITNTTTGAVLKSNNSVFLYSDFARTPIQTLDAYQLSSLFYPSSLTVTGFSRQELSEFQYNGTLPDGSYSFCFEYWASNSVGTPTNQTDVSSNNCTFGMTISAANQLIKVNTTINKNIYLRKYDELSNAGVLNVIFTSYIEDYDFVMDILIIGDNGLQIKSKANPCNFANGMEIGPSRTTVYVAKNSDIVDALDFNNVDVTGPSNLVSDFFRSKYLPDGNYTICIKSSSSTSTSANCETTSDPTTGCANFTVTTDQVNIIAPFTQVQTINHRFDDFVSFLPSFMLTSRSEQPSNSYISLTVTGDNGVSFLSFPVFFINEIKPNIPTSLSTSDISFFFISSNVKNVIGMNENQFKADGLLPDGNYTLCFEVFSDVARTQKLSPINNGCSQLKIFTDPIFINTISQPFTERSFDDIAKNINAITLSTQSNRTNVKIGLSLTGNNGVSIKTDLSNSPLFFPLISANVPIVISIPQIISLFNKNILTTQGIDVAEFMTTGNLPDGNYNLCFNAYNDLGQVISNPNSNNCVIPFSLQTAPNKLQSIHTSLNEPPMLLLPFCGTEITETNPQNVIFNWSLPSSTSLLKMIATQEFTLRIVEMPTTSNPYDAFRTATTPFFFEKDIRGTVYNYGLGDPKLEIGRKYAYSVFVTNGKENYRNLGQSDICYFTYGEASPQKDSVIDNKPVVNPKTQTIVNAKIMFTHGELGDANKPAPFETNMEHPADENTPYVLANQHVKLKTAFGIVPVFQTKKFVPKIIKKDTTWSWVDFDSISPFYTKLEFQAYLGDDDGGLNTETIKNLNKQVASGTTDINGNVNFSIYPSSNYNCIFDTLLPEFAQNILLNSKQADIMGIANPFAGVYKWKMVRGYVMDIANPIYTDPSIFICPQIGQYADAGTVITNVNSYQLSVDLNDDLKPNSGKNNRPKNTITSGPVTVYLLKKDNSEGYPPYEGNPSKRGTITIKMQQGGYNNYLIDETYIVLDKISVPYNEDVHFLRLYESFSKDDKYYVYAEYEKGNTFFEPISFSRYTKNGWEKYNPEQSRSYSKEHIKYSPSLVDGVVKGSMTYSFYNFETKQRMPAKKMQAGISLKLVRMEVNYSSGNGKYTFKNIKEIDKTVTDEKGDFTFRTGKLDYNKYLENTANGTIPGNLYILVDNKYYLSPDKQIFISSESTSTDVGVLEAYVRQGQYGSKIVTREKYVPYDQNNKNFTPRAGDKVFMCRKKGVKIEGLPNDEGNIIKTSFSKSVIKDMNGAEYEILDETTTEGNGTYKFSRWVYRDENNQNDKVYIYSEVPVGSGENYKTPNPIWINLQQQFANSYILNSQFKPEFYGTCYSSDNLWCGEISEPQDAYIVGAVYPETNTTQSLSGVLVEMFDMSKNKTPAQGVQMVEKDEVTSQTYQKTHENGKFEFRDLNAGNKNGWKILRFSKKGFNTKIVVINNGAIIKKGKRESLDKVMLELPITTTCYVRDIEGKDVFGKIIVGNQYSWGQIFGKVFPKKGTSAELDCPSGMVSFIFVPENSDVYCIDTFKQNITKGMSYFEYVAKKKTHRIMIYLYNNKDKSIPCEVTVTNLANPITVTSKFMFGKHYAYLEFYGSGTEFDLKIVPDDVHEIVYKTIQNTAGKNIQSIDEISKDAYVISGIVTETKAIKFPKKMNVQHVIADAMVYAKGYENTIGMATTAKDGTYKLAHIPIKNSYKVYATKEGFVGASLKVNKIVFPSSKILKGQDFILKKFDDLDITSLYGFPLLVETLTEYDDKVKITGKLRIDPGAKAENKSKYGNTQYTEIDVLGNQEYYASIYEVTIKKISFNKDKNNINLSKDQYDAVKLGINSLPFSLYNTYNGTIENPDGLVLYPSNKEATEGVIEGYVSIDPSSFEKGFSYGENIYLNKLSNQNIIEANATYKRKKAPSANSKGADLLSYSSSLDNYLNLKGLKGSKEKTIKTDMMSLYTSNGLIPTEYSNGFKISDKEAKTIIYTLHYYKEVGTKNSSTFNKYGLHLNSNVHTDLNHVAPNPDINMNIGTIDISSKSISSISESKEFTIALGKWNIVAQNWEMNKSGFIITKGRLDAAGVSVPFTNMLLGQDEIQFAKFEFTQVKILNNEKLKLKINPTNTITAFGYDMGYGGSESNGAWSLSIIAKTGDYLSDISGLPDLETNDKIYISNINLYNTGDDKILLKENHPAVTIAGVTQFYPTVIYGTAYSITFKGNISIAIPNLTGLSNVSYELIYENDKKAGLVHKPSIEKFVGLKLRVNGINVDIDKDNQYIKNNQIKLYGNLTDIETKSKYNFNVIITKNGGKDGETMLVMNNEKKPKNIFYFKGNSGSRMENLDGSMKVINGAWNNFIFEGDITDADGIDDKHKHLKFEVKGDLVANNSNVGVTNMSAGGMDGLSITYDFEKSALVGSGHMDQQTPNGRYIGDLELFIGSSEFYFFSSLKVLNLKNCPINEFGAGFFVGNGKINQNMKTAMATHFHENILPAYISNLTDYKGIFFAGGFEIPIPKVPTWKINIGGMVESSLSHGIYGACYFATNFSKDPELAIGGQVGAWVKLGAGVSIGLACFNISLTAEAGMDISGTIKTTGNFAINVNVFLALHGSAYIGGGICNSSCQTPCWSEFGIDICSPIPCVKTGWSGGDSITLSGELNNNGFKIGFN